MAVKGKANKLLAGKNSTKTQPVKQDMKTKSKLLDYRNIKTFKEMRKPEILLDDASRMQTLKEAKRKTQSDGTHLPSLIKQETDNSSAYLSLELETLGLSQENN